MSRLLGLAGWIRYHKIKATVALILILTILVSKLGFFSDGLWSVGQTRYHLHFLDFTPHSSMSSPNSTSTAYPVPFVREPTMRHENTLILLHGTSQDGPTFASSFLSFPIPHLKSKTLSELFPSTRFVFPTGRERYCTVLGRESHAWFDFASFADRTVNESLQIPGLGESSIYLSKLVESEIDLLLGEGKGGNADGREGAGEGDVARRQRREDARRRVVVGGFSQGSAIACIALLSGTLDGHERGRIGGFVGMSGWLPFRKQILERIKKGEGLEKEIQSSQTEKLKAVMDYLRHLLGLPELKKGNGLGVEKIPVFLGHGADDVKMRPEWGREMGVLLGEVGMSVQFTAYEGLEHWWNQGEMEDLVGFLRCV